MPRPRFFRLPQPEQDRILDVAEKAFAGRGYDVSFNALIRDLGLSKGSMYYYFDDKADLFQTTCYHAVQGVIDWVGEWRKAAGAEEFWVEAHRVYDRFAFFMLANPTAARLVWSYMAVASDPRHQAYFGDASRRVRAWAAALINEGRDLGAIRADISADLQLEAFLSVGAALDKRLMARLETSGEDAVSSATTEAMALIRGMLQG